jgi:hypothetical protein
VTASRIVGYVDDLERHALHLTEAGTRFFAELSELFRQREKQLVSQLDQEQCDELRELLTKIAQQGGPRAVRPPRLPHRSSQAIRVISATMSIR